MRCCASSPATILLRTSARRILTGRSMNFWRRFDKKSPPREKLARGRVLCAEIDGVEKLRTGVGAENFCAGGRFFVAGSTLPLWCPPGGLPFWLPAAPAFSLLSCPLSPLPPSPDGEGGILGFLMQGAPPLASPGAEPARHGARGRTTHPAGGLPRRCRLTWPLWCSQGGAYLFGRLPALPLVLLLPHPPTPPSPAGKGETKVISCKGLRPLHPRG